MKKIIEHINKTLDRVGNGVEIYLGALTETQIKKLQKHFKMTKAYMGYWKFEKISKQA